MLWAGFPAITLPSKYVWAIGCDAPEDLARALDPSLLKEFSQQRGGLLFTHTRIDLWPVETLRLIEYSPTMLDCAALGI